MTNQAIHVKKTIGINLKKIRERLGLTHKELSEICGVAKGSIITIEQGNKGYGIDTLLMLTQTLGFTISEVASEKMAIPEYLVLKNNIHSYYKTIGSTLPNDFFKKQDRRVKNLILTQVIPSKFLNKGRFLHEILAYCKDELGAVVKSTSLSNTLKRLAGEGRIEVKQINSNAFKYKKKSHK